MNVDSLLPAFKLHARIDHADEDPGLILMLQAAASGVAYAAAYTLPALASELPDDLRFAIIDQAANTYEHRGDDMGKPGLCVSASRIVARYRGVSIGAAEIVTVA